MGIVAKACSRRRWAGVGAREWKALCLRTRPTVEGYAQRLHHLRGGNGRHSRLERLIGSAVPMRALLSAALGASTITVGVRGHVMTCHRRMAQRCGSAARLRSAAWCRRNRDGRLGRGTRDTGIEQPMTEGEAVAAGTIGEKAIVADAMEAVREGMQEKAAD